MGNAFGRIYNVPDGGLQTVSSNATLSEIVSSVSESGGGNIVLGACTGTCYDLSSQYLVQYARGLSAPAAETSLGTATVDAAAAAAASEAADGGRIVGIISGGGSIVGDNILLAGVGAAAGGVGSAIYDNLPNDGRFLDVVVAPAASGIANLGAIGEAASAACSDSLACSTIANTNILFVTSAASAIGNVYTAATSCASGGSVGCTVGNIVAATGVGVQTGLGNIATGAYNATNWVLSKF